MPTEFDINYLQCLHALCAEALLYKKMDKELKIFYTSDVHGYFSPVDYTNGGMLDRGLANCFSSFRKDGNTLIIDGGDTLQGSPLTYYLYSQNSATECAPARLMNLGGYDFITLGNHDFDYGRGELERYISELDARCLCANLDGVKGVEKTAVVTLENGLRVGLCGVSSHFVRFWERAENLEGMDISDAFEAARWASAKLRSECCDITLCIYHGGYERNLTTDEILSESGENQGCRICDELDFDIVLCAHQHMATQGRMVAGSFTCQGDDKARHYTELTARVSGDGSIYVCSQLHEAGKHCCDKAWEYLEPIEEKAAVWLDKPMGHLDTELMPAEHIRMAAEGSYIANFYNQVQLEYSGADISVTSLANELRGFKRSVSIRDVVASYVFPNTLKVLEVDRAVLKKALERCGEYFELDEKGGLRVSECFLKPLEQHFNYDFFSGINVTMDLRRPVGERVVSIVYDGGELEQERKLKLCMNNYRASGAGGYECYRKCRLIAEQPTEISELIMDYISKKQNISVDKTKWLKLIY